MRRMAPESESVFFISERIVKRRDGEKLERDFFCEKDGSGKGAGGRRQ